MKKMSMILMIAASLLFAGTAFGHTVAVDNTDIGGFGGLFETNFKLAMNYIAGTSVEASVASSHPDSESIYRASFGLHITAANAAAMPQPSFNYFFQTFGSGFFSGPPVSWAIRVGIQRVNGNSNLRGFVMDNQRSRRGTGSCAIPDDEDVLVELNWAAAQAGAGTFQINTYEGGSATPTCTRNVIGGLTNGFTRIVSQLFITKPDNNNAIVNDFTLYVDEFASFRTLSTP